jgi:hypothetical protein
MWVWKIYLFYLALAHHIHKMSLCIKMSYIISRARWPRGRCARRAIADAKQRSQWSVIGLVTKIYYLELLRDPPIFGSRWPRLHLQSLAPTPVSRRVDVRQAAGRKNNCRIFKKQHDKKHVLSTSLSGKRVEKERLSLASLFWATRQVQRRRDTFVWDRICGA